MTVDDIDVAKILGQLKQEIRERHREEQIHVALARTTVLEEARAKSWVNPHWPIAWPHWPKGLTPKIVALVQKLIRRLLRWYINPIVDEQNRFNAAVIAALETLAYENAQLRAELRDLGRGHMTVEHTEDGAR